MAFVVGFCVLEDEAVGALQAIGTLFHAIRAVLEMEAFHTVLRALWEVRKKSIVFFRCTFLFGKHAVALNVMMFIHKPTMCIIVGLCINIS